MPNLSRLVLLGTIVLLLASCQPPSYAQGHPDSRNSGPFWLRERQQD